MKLRFGANFLLVCQALLGFVTGNRADEVNTASLVINGKVAPLERYPYMVEFWPDPGCGGSLIHPEVVISAGHCFNIEGLKNPTDVDIGRHTLEQKIDGDTYETIKISDILVHPDYPQNPDVALIKLKEESIMYPVELSNDPNDISQGTVVTTVGWGCYKQNNQARCLDYSEKLRYAELEMNTQSFCRNEFGPAFNKDVEMCARDPTEQRSDCNGDSGGPIIKRGNNYSKDVQVGLVSWGPEDCLSGPSVYAKVQGTIYQWVKETMKKEWGLTLGVMPPTPPIAPTTEPPTKFPSSVSPAMGPSDGPVAQPCFNLKAKKCDKLDQKAAEKKCKKEKFQKNCRFQCFQCYPYNGVTSDCCYATYKKGNKSCKKTAKDSKCKKLVCDEFPDCCEKKKKWGTICARAAERACDVCF